MTYPRKIADHALAAFSRVAAGDLQAEGVGANLACGSYVRFFVSVGDDGRISSVRLRSNGCGYMLASANVLAEFVSGLDLRELHGSKDNDFGAIITRELGKTSNTRAECVQSAVEALKAAFLDLRSRRIQEFRGEEALICTCFGVAEERIEAIISTGTILTVDDVTDACNAGGGCGSCRMLIQEMLDGHRE